MYKIGGILTIKRLGALLIIWSFTLLSTSFIWAEMNNSPSPEEFVKEFLCNKMCTLVSKNIDEIDKYYSEQAPNAQKYLMFTKQNLLRDYLIAYASNDYIIEKVTPEVVVISSMIKDDIATIEAILKTSIYWNASNALGEPIVGVKSEKHLLILHKENNDWKIVVDKYMTSRGHSDESIKEELNSLSDTTDRLKKDAMDSISKSKRSKPSRLTMAFSVSQSGPKLKYPVSYNTKSTFPASNGSANQSIPIKNTTYNRDAAYNWAYTYWNNYSTAYVNLGAQKWEGGDCTNFVSQCVTAGGANNDKIGNYQWYYENKGTKQTKDDKYSWTWSTSKGFNYMILGNFKTNEYGPKGIEKTITGDLNYSTELGEFLTYGDVVQYQWSASSKLSHTAIIVNMIYNSSKDRYEPVIAEHTYDSWSTPWTNNAYKTYFIHITGVN